MVKRPVLQCNGGGNFLGVYYSGQSLLKLFELHLDSLEDFLCKVIGNFAAIVEKEGAVYVVTDKIRSYPLFVKECGDDFLVTDCIEEILGRANGDEIDKKAEYELLRAGYTFSKDTLLMGVWQIPAGCYGIIDDGFHIKEYHNFIHNKENELDDETIKRISRDIMEKAFGRMLSSIEPGTQIVIPLSGGYDSRLIACLCKQHDIENVVCYTYGRKDSFEVLTSKKVAEQLHYRWIFVEYTDEYLMSFANNEAFLKFVDTAGNLCSLPHYQDYFAVSYMHQHHLIDDGAVILPGYVGDVYGGSKYKPEKTNGIPKPSKEDLYNLIVSEFFEWNLKLNDKNLNNSCLSEYLDTFTVNTTDDLLDISETYWFMKSRACNFILNSVRTYELFSYQWRVPLLDDEYVSFWYSIPWEKKEKPKLYNEYMFDYYFNSLHVDYYKTVPSTVKAAKVGSNFKSLIPSSVRTWIRNVYFKLHPSTVNCNSQLTLIKLFKALNPRNGKLPMKGALSYAMDVNSIVTRVTINRLQANLLR